LTTNGAALSGARPEILVAELTHRCPLGCPYCSNPLALETRDGELDVATWARVFSEAAALGIQRVDLSGGEPGARRDLVEIAASAREAGLYTNLVTSGVGISTRTVRDLWEAGLDHVSVSFQHSDAVPADRIAGGKGAFQRKYALATEAVRLGLPLAVNVVMHRANIECIEAIVELAMTLKASRVEIAPVRYLGWASHNRAALMPTRGQSEGMAVQAEELRKRHRNRIVIDVMPERWGEPSFLTITPSGKVLPCESAGSMSGLELWNVREHALESIWMSSPAFRAFHDVGRGPPSRGVAADFDPHVHGAAADAGRPYRYRR
jgi:pyrroloquinoline quinone biosynthesis protein E